MWRCVQEEEKQGVQNIGTILLTDEKVQNIIYQYLNPKDSKSTLMFFANRKTLLNVKVMANYIGPSIPQSAVRQSEAVGEILQPNSLAQSQDLSPMLLRIDTDVTMGNKNLFTEQKASESPLPSQPDHHLNIDDMLLLQPPPKASVLTSQGGK